MAESLDRIAQRLKEGKNLGVDKRGTLMESDPRNDGTSKRNVGNTTIEPKVHYAL